MNQLQSQPLNYNLRCSYCQIVANTLSFYKIKHYLFLISTIKIQSIFHLIESYFPTWLHLLLRNVHVVKGVIQIGQKCVVFLSKKRMTYLPILKSQDQLDLPQDVFFTLLSCSHLHGHHSFQLARRKAAFPARIAKPWNNGDLQEPTRCLLGDHIRFEWTSITVCTFCMVQFHLRIFNHITFN